MRPNLGRLSTFESLWEAWCDPIRVLIRVLQLGLAQPLQRLDLGLERLLSTGRSWPSDREQSGSGGPDPAVY
jgi:hypothetical protein